MRGDGHREGPRTWTQFPSKAECSWTQPITKTDLNVLKYDEMDDSY